jgi:hypothetical protein
MVNEFEPEEKKESKQETETQEFIKETSIPINSNELVISGNIKGFIDDLKESKETAEVVSLKSETLGFDIELVSRKFNVIELSDLALQLMTKIPIEIKKVGYIQ